MASVGDCLGVCLLYESSSGLGGWLPRCVSTVRVTQWPRLVTALVCVYCTSHPVASVGDCLGVCLLYESSSGLGG